MTHAVEAGLVVATVSAFMYIALGAWVLTLTPRRLQTKLLAAFAIFFGLIYATLDVAVIFDLVASPSRAQLALQVPFILLAEIAAFGLAWAVPEPLKDRRLLAWGLGTGALLAAVSWIGDPLMTGQLFEMSTVDWVLDALLSVVSTFGAGASALLALRARPRPDGSSTGEVTQVGILAVAFASLGAFVSGMDVVWVARVVEGTGGAGAILEAAEPLIVWSVLGGLWLRNMIRADDDTVRVHRAVALGIFGLLTAGALYQAVFPGADPGSNVMRGVMRTLGVGLLAYGVLRHDLAGLDAKVEWGLSKTTVAGIFVAVFFIVSEGAQVLFAGFANSELLGIVAAGALLFALSPIQRLADRIAAKAVPGGAEEGRVAERSYRRAVRIALSDGEIERGEERELADLADDLGISAGRAFELREEVADEVGPDGGDTA